jgi:ATP-binding cassette, subfamily B, bacterial
VRTNLLAWPQRCGANVDGQPPFPIHAGPFIWHYVLRRRWHFGVLLALLIGGASCAVAVQYGMRILVDAMSASEGDRDAVWAPCALFVGLIAVESVLWRSAGWLTCRTVIATGVDIRLRLFQHLSGHAMHYFADHLAGSLAARVTATAGSVTSLITLFAWNILPPCTDFLGAMILFAAVDVRMAGALAAFVVVLVSAMAFYGAQGWPLHRAHAEQANLVGGELVDTTASIWAVKAFSARDRELQRLARTLAAEGEAQARSWLHIEKTRAIHDIALWVAASVLLVWSVHLWTTRAISPGEVVMVSALTFRILFGSRDLAMALIGTAQQFAVVGEALSVIGRPHAVVDRHGAKPLVARGGAIEFRNVSFGHVEGHTLFDRISLRIPAGQKVGLVGLSGAGKSTLVGLLQRLEDVQDGEILIDGQPLTAVTQDSLRAAIAVVPQEVSLFHRTVLENIRYGRPELSDDEVLAAARAACCDEFVRALPEGYDTLVGERGTKLSGGQRQRLGIARAILKDAPILILDEATSALDSRSEAAVQRALVTLLRGRTVLAIAHRLSTLSALDRVVVLVDGKIVEDGPPAELQRAGGVFDALWRMQVASLSASGTAVADAA